MAVGSGRWPIATLGLGRGRSHTENGPCHETAYANRTAHVDGPHVDGSAVTRRSQTPGNGGVLDVTQRTCEAAKPLVTDTTGP